MLRGAQHLCLFFIYVILFTAKWSRETLVEWDKIYMYYVYILFNSQIKEYYVGYSNDLKKRLTDHKHDKVQTTKNKGGYNLVWYCVFNSKHKALMFEKYLKSSSGYAFRKKHFL